MKILRSGLDWFHDPRRTAQWRSCVLIAAWTAGFLCAWLGGSLAAAESDLADTSAAQRFFRERIEPVLVTHCYECHSSRAEDLQAGLRLDSREGLLRGGDSGPVIVPGKSSSSLLVHAIRHEQGLEMPPEKPRLDDQVIADIVRWIDAGAVDPRGDVKATTAPAPADKAKEHWAFEPIRRPAIPNVRAASWLSTPVDAFVLSALEQRSWSPAPPVSRDAWLRRVYFDLIGLPPTPEEVAAFVQDKRPDAEARVVDQLLGSTHYGERWSQHWLDVVRFAETEGYEYDRHLPGAWRFRDYVIESLNDDKPFDQFLVEQLAGDELGPLNPETLTASVFHRLGPVRRNAGNPEIALSRNEVLTERTDILGAAFLGMTIGCARCHNHKLEPISQRDYYSLQAYLAATDEHNVVLASTAEQDAWEAETKRLNAEIQALRKKSRAATGEEKGELKRQISELEALLPPPLPTIPATRNHAEARTEIHVLRRGVWENKGDRVGPRPPSVLLPEEYPELPAEVENPRTHLARWMASPENPLVARVLVNRIWHYHFGQGLVKTVNDFGLHGDHPSHPELLDWLATTFIESGWHWKPIHRLIVLSSTYRQSSRTENAGSAAVADPENRLLWQFQRRRLSAEEVRDAMLSVAGRLTHRQGGPSVIVPVEQELVNLLYAPSQWQVTADPAEHDRRSIYLIAKRNLRLPFFETFDAPAMLTSCGRRESSTHAPQALELLNGRISNELARSFAERLRQECGDNVRNQMERAFHLAFGRGPTEAERALSLEFLAHGPLEEFTLALFNLNGFLYVP